MHCSNTQFNCIIIVFVYTLREKIFNNTIKKNLPPREILISTVKHFQNITSFKYNRKDLNYSSQ